LSSNNPIRQGRRRGWASKILPGDWQREMGAIACRLSQGELDEITQYWLAAKQAADSGDYEMRWFVRGTFGRWAAEIMRLRAS
jgi:hypothetical protein